MIALRTSPAAPSAIECNVFGERRTFANVVARFTAEVSSVSAIGLNLRAPVGSHKKQRKVAETNGPDFREVGRGRQPRWDDRARVYDEIPSPPVAAVGIALGAYPSIADDEHNGCDVPRAFDVCPECIMKT